MIRVYNKVDFWSSGPIRKLRGKWSSCVKHSAERFDLRKLVKFFLEDCFNCKICCKHIL